jgi:plastocyanin
MMLTRRHVLWWAGACVAVPALPPLARGAGLTRIRMMGNQDGSRVWFDPIGIHVQPGQVVQWVNTDPGNSHTSTAYHPANFDRPQRIPNGAKPWDSNYLLPNETFSVTLTRPGVYDYYCVPHEHAGMVGRIIVGTPPPRGWPEPQNPTGGEGALPEVALKAFPSVAEILRTGVIHRRA